MKEKPRANPELIEEISALKQKIKQMEQSDSNRKRAEEALQESETKFRTIFESFEDIYYQTDLNGIITLISPSVYHISGWKPEELVGQPATLVYAAPGDRAALLKAMAEHGYVRDYELTLIMRDGSKVMASLAANLIYDSSGAPAGVAGSLRNITDRKQAEEALRESEERYKNLFDNHAAVKLIIDPDTGRITDANEAAAHYYGWSREQLKQMKIQEINTLSPEDIKKEMEKARTNKRVYFEFRHRRADESIRDVEVFSSKIKVKRTELLHSIIHDITERKRAEEALQASEQKYRHLFEKAEEGILIVRGESIEFANPALARILGQPLDRITARPFVSFIHPEDREMVFDRHRRRMRGETVETGYDFRIVTSDGDVRWLRITSRVIEWDNLTASLSFLADITDRKRAEEEKRILEERLQHADKMESIGTLAGGIAHDFNNLLMGIQGYASLTLLDLDPSHPHYQRLKRIEEQVQSGADLTRQLLGFARGGRYEVKPADMNDIIKKTSSMFGRTKKEIIIHRKYEKDLWTVEVDQGQMEQVFMNLYVNAWQAMPGGGEIYLETENVFLEGEQAFPYTVKPGKYVKITFTDTGTGMDAKTKERIFDPFFTTKEMGRGTGLGLATVYGIIKGHKGVINVDSELGHGTTFSIYLPASEKEAVKEKAAAGSIARGTETILLVDDEKMVLEVSKALLESLGYGVYAAGSGQEAIAVYMEKRNEIDLVILDMIMPGISGGETFDRLKEINPDIRVLLSSGYSIEGQARTIMDRGCNAFLQKPFQLEMLSRSVRKVLD